MKKTKRLLAIVLCILIFALPILSECFIATHRKHNCTGKTCAVCCEIHMAERLIETLKTIFLYSACSIFFMHTFFLSPVYKKQIHRVGDTLITLKVELLN